MAARMMLVAAGLLAAAVGLAAVSRTEAVPIRESLRRFPMQIDRWAGQRLPDPDDEILDVLGVDEYVNRSYARADGMVWLYLGYHATQREGVAIHSPMNCLPGAGWSPIESGRLAFPVATGGSTGGQRTIEVNRYVIQKGLQHHLVLYWYQSHDRVIASEYWGKAYLIVDAIRLNRTDASLIRVISPIVGSGPGAETAAERLAIEFVQSMFPLLGRYLPA